MDDKDFKEAILVGNVEVIPFIVSAVSNFYPAYYLHAIEKHNNLIWSNYPSGRRDYIEPEEGNLSDKKLDILANISQQISEKGHIASGAKIEYLQFIRRLYTLENTAIENVYIGLSVEFNAHMYSYLQDKCDELDITLLEALGRLPKFMKFLIIITNIVQVQENVLNYYVDIYGEPIEVWNILWDPLKGEPNLATALTHMMAINENENYDIHLVYIFIIQFFGIANKYFTLNIDQFFDKGINEEVLITKYFTVSRESDELIRDIAEKSPTVDDKLRIIIANFLVAPMYSILQEGGREGEGEGARPASAVKIGGSKTRRKKPPSKKRNMKIYRHNNKYKRSNTKKKHDSRKIKKKTKKQTTRRKK